MKSAPSPRPRPLTPRRLLALIAAVACGWAAYSLYGEAAQDRALAASVAQLQSANTTLQQQIAERSLEIEEAQGSAWVEEQARKLGFHLPGEFDIRGCAVRKGVTQLRWHQRRTAHLQPDPGADPHPLAGGGDGQSRLHPGHRNTDTLAHLAHRPRPNCVTGALTPGRRPCAMLPLRRGAVEARRAHNPKVAGSNPAAATMPLSPVISLGGWSAGGQAFFSAV